MLLVATHTKTCRQTGEYILLVKRGWSLSSVREGMTRRRLFLLGARHRLDHMALKTLPESCGGRSSEERPELSNVGSWSEPQCSCLRIADLTNKHREKLSQKASLRLSSSESERSRRWAHSRKTILEVGVGEKSSVQLCVDWKVHEINWTQPVWRGKDKQKEQGGRGSLHRQPQNIS